MFKPTDVLAQVLVALAETIRELDESPRQNQPPEPFLDRIRGLLCLNPPRPSL